MSIVDRNTATRSCQDKMQAVAILEVMESLLFLLLHLTAHQRTDKFRRCRMKCQREGILFPTSILHFLYLEECCFQKIYCENV